MSGARFALPYSQPVDATGTPYPGGQLFFYATGTDNPQATYSDQGLTIPNTQPVVADSTGTFPAIWLGATAYRVVLEDVAGDQIWTADPVGPSVVVSF